MSDKDKNQYYWRDGNTAPKDGSKFLAIDSLGDYQICEWVERVHEDFEMVENGLYKKVSVNWGFWNDNTPLMWMPLPEKPSHDEMKEAETRFYTDKVQS